ncbi:uncharacterized protein [Spinacia oleracea]|uniref:Uncharacterized protein isoform X3 n=1 Tax=Spinacia oleracea TaxID=3562 RepID=A0A9R0I331_SPIOL|nr:uncharacterized protein LOC110782016 isoform X3 [Spinacia oleracea]XP_056693786.1 uncharacterized protein LOC110782016 isoform X3 [Spinacia oleracea]
MAIHLQVHKYISVLKEKLVEFFTRTNLPRTPDIARLAEEFEKKPNPTPWDTEFLEMLKASASGYRERYHISGTPVFELSFVSIYKDKFKEFYDDDDPCIELYGHIKLVDDNDYEYYLFNQDCSDAKTVNLLYHKSVILRGSQHSRPLLLPKFFSVEICLKDRKRDVVIIKEYFSLDFSGEVKYDTEQQLECNSNGHGLASVTYTIF